MIGGEPVRDNNRLINYGKEQVQLRLSSNEGNEKGLEDRIDFLSKLVAFDGDKKSGWYPRSLDLDTEALNMTVAGADPFSHVLAGTFFYLVHNPEYLKKASEEVRYVTVSSMLTGLT